jgi:uncharacterized repeat protein (TIGR03803 family)
MRCKGQYRNLLFGTSSGGATAALTIVIALTLAATPAAQAQTFTVIHNFTGGGDGANPYAGLTIDRGGSLYGTAANGGAGSGTVFRLAHKNSVWLFTPLYRFNGSPAGDGAGPAARVVFGPDGSLYGTTFDGGGAGCGGGGCGTVFNLKPPVSACKTALCPWTETVLYRFTGGNDGAVPEHGDLVFDQARSLYGTTFAGGSSNVGTVYKLTPSNGHWTESVLYSFTGGLDASAPYPGVVFDAAGNLNGTTFYGGFGKGTVFQLTPVGNGWSDKLLYGFQGGSDGGYPVGGLINDQSGNFYGTSSAGGPGGGGTVYELTLANGAWTYSLVYGFSGPGGPLGNLIMDKAGSLYGTTYADGGGLGNVFKLTPSNGGWTYTDLHDFAGSDGANPYGSLAFDTSGNLFGTTSAGGTGSACAGGCGVVFEITPN